MPGFVLPGPGGAIAGNRAIDDTGVDGRHAVVIEPEPLDDTRPEVLDDDIGVADERQYGGVVLGVFEVGRETFFVAIDGMKQRTIAVQRQIADVELAT